MSSHGWIIGLAIYAVGRSSMALGANMQRLSLRREQQKDESERRPKKKQPVLVGGIVLYAASGIFLSIALIFASPTLLAPCGTIIFVANAFFAHVMNDEKFSLRSDGPPIALIVAGTVAVVISAPKENKEFTNDELIRLCKEPSFIAFLVVLVSFIVAMFLTSRYLMRGLLKQQSNSPATALQNPSPVTTVESDEENMVVAVDPPPPCDIKRKNTVETLAECLEDASEDEVVTGDVDDQNIKFQANEPVEDIQRKVAMPSGLAWNSPRVLLWYMSFGMLAGGLGALNITFTKSIFSLIQGKLESEGMVGALQSPFFWGFGLLLAATYISQMMCTTNGLDKTPATIFVPTQSVTEETMAILGGLFYFQDFQLFTPVTAVIFTAGETCTILATILLTRRQIRRNGGPMVQEDLSHDDPLEFVTTKGTASTEDDEGSDPEEIVEATDNWDEQVL